MLSSAAITAQAFNVLWTLLLAYPLFGGKILPLQVRKQRRPAR